MVSEELMSGHEFGSLPPSGLDILIDAMLDRWKAPYVLDLLLIFRWRSP